MAGVRFSSLPQSSYLFSSIINQRCLLQKQATVAILQGFARSGSLRWRDLDETVRDVLTNATMTAFSSDGSGKNWTPSDDAKVSSNIIHSLGRLHCKWNGSDIPREICDLLACKLIPPSTGSHVLSGQIISHAINGLSRMDASWSDIQRVLFIQTTGCTYVLSAIDVMSTHELANTVWSLGSRRVAWDDIDIPFRSALKSRICRIACDMTGYEFAWTLWALAKMEVKWKIDLDQKEREQLLSAADIAANMAPQEIGVLLWSLLNIQAPPSEYSNTLKAKFVENVEFILRKNSDRLIRTPEESSS